MIKQIRIKPHTEQWHQFRYDNGYGGSEIASVVSAKTKTLANHVYTPALKMHLMKIGEPVQEFTGNVESESGHFFEPIILGVYLKYFDLDNPNQIQMFKNIKDGVRINKVLQPKVFVTNSKYPWLFYSPDAFSWKNCSGAKRLAESKNTTSMAANQFPNHVDPAFFCQCQQGLMLTELDHADLCILIDGRWFEVVTIEPDKTWFDLIMEVSYNSWLNVLKARKIKLEYEVPAYFGVNPDLLSEKQKDGALMLAELEPAHSGTDDELDFIYEMVKPTPEETIMRGNDDLYNLCLEYKAISEKIGEINASKNIVAEKLILGLGGFHKAYFGNDEKVYYSFKEDSRKIKRLYISPKIK